MPRPYATASLDLGRMPATRRRHTFALRSQSAPDGWVAGPKRPTTRKPRPTVDDTGVIQPLVTVNDDMPLIRFDAAEERHLAGVIRMGDLD